MLDFNAPEFLIVAIVALLVIGPKDLPRAMRFVGQWVGKARGVARQFRSGIDTMMREAELAELEKKWAEENARILREHPPAAQLPAPSTDPATYAQALADSAQPVPHPAPPADTAPEDAPAAMVAQPDLRADRSPAAPVSQRADDQQS